ncbi:MAG TPA: SDR family oxidoreductase [Alphaproteobacteria bacterium]|nr:SDR family oxidoreductase [Alphaproteobacteria bacterium]
MMTTPEQAVLVTGAARRIGADLARGLAADGWFVHVHYDSSAREAEAVASELRDAGGAARAVQADLADPDDLATLLPRCAADAPPLRALVNNASLFRRDHVHDMTTALWDRHMAVNMRAPAFLARNLAAAVPDGETGCVINILDNKVFALNPDYFSYTASKYGLHGLTQTLAMALAPKLRVCGIAPGITLVSDRQSPEEFEKAHRNNPLGRGCSVEEIVAAARLILASPAMTGRTIVIDGGQSLMRAPRDVAFL